MSVSPETQALVEVMTSAWPDAAVFVVDDERRVVLWSPGAERLLGFTEDALLGRSCLEGNRCSTCIRGCGVAEYGRIDGALLTLHDIDGEPVPVRKYARALTDEHGNFRGAVEVLVPAPAAPPSDRELESFHGLFSRDPAMRRAFDILRRVASGDASVLIRGESGTGKELAARAVHDESSRRDALFLAVNCAALTPSLLESELFGHVRGAFTGAVRSRDGLFKRADGGTLFLDEVAELPLELQAKLLRVLQEQIFTPVGGSTPIRVDVRIVAATHRGLRARVADGLFREDLMYRLRVVPVFLTPLRERVQDVEMLLWRFIRQRNEVGARQVVEIEPEAMRSLLNHGWPGNVRELMNVVQYAFAVGQGPRLVLNDLPPEFHLSPARKADPATRIRDALSAEHGNIGRAAERLGVSRATFWRMRRKHSI